MGNILKRIKYGAVIGGTTLIAIATPTLATTSDLINDTTAAVESFWPLLILFFILSLLFGFLGGLASKMKI